MSFTIGIAIADTTFERPVGDAGNPASYPHPVIFETVAGVTAADIVRPSPNFDVMGPYLKAAIKLQHRGATAITTTCGFLSPFQHAIAGQLRVPFIASSLLQIPLVHSLVQGRIGIITANDDALTEVYLRAAGIGESIPAAILGLQRCKEFADPILRNIGATDFASIEAAVASAAAELVESYPDIKALVCECHNLAPFGPAIQRETNRPVFDILTLVGMVAQASAKPVFDQTSKGASPHSPSITAR